MIYKATKLIQEEMDRRELKYSVEELDNSSIVRAGFAINNGPNARVSFISRDNDNDVAIRLFGVVSKVSENKVDKILRVLNYLNNHYRYLKFVLDDDRDINVLYDIPLRAGDSTVGAEACEIFVRFMQIMDDAYNEIMKGIWS